MGRGGFEPPKSKTSDLQSDPFGRSGICPYEIVRCVVEPVIGLEPTTCWLQISCSANWATPACGALGRNRTTDRQIFSLLLYQLSYQGIWRPKTGSNRRPPAWQAGALTNWAIGPFAECALNQALVYNTLFIRNCQAFCRDFFAIF